MNLSFTSEQNLLRQSVARFCKDRAPLSVIRELSYGSSGTSQPAPASQRFSGLTEDLWNEMAGQSWLGVLVPEVHGGLGLGTVELGIIMEEMGRALFPGPYLSCAALAAPILSQPEVGDDLKASWLPALCSGEKRVTLALLEADAQLRPASIQLTARQDGPGYLLSGSKFFVPDLLAADAVICAARSEAGIGLFLVETGQPGVTRHEDHLTDATSRSGKLVLEEVRVDPDHVIGGPLALGDGFRLCERALLAGNVALSAASVAGAEQVLKTAVGYVKERKQFGVAVGSFQAVKHPLANLFSDIESARSAYHYAAWAVDAGSKDRRQAVAVARLTATAAFRQATLTSLQAHGGIGFTWEYDLHLYLKRAKHNEYFLGVAADYEEIVASEALGI